MMDLISSIDYQVLLSSSQRFFLLFFCVQLFNNPVYASLCNEFSKCTMQDYEAMRMLKKKNR